MHACMTACKLANEKRPRTACTLAFGQAEFACQVKRRDDTLPLPPNYAGTHKLRCILTP
jgi:hypothetical protein